MARNVGATLAVARGMGDEILRCAQNDRTGGAGDESHHRFAVPLPLTREAKDAGSGAAQYYVLK
jgi:hypothetical protein